MDEGLPDSGSPGAESTLRGEGGRSYQYLRLTLSSQAS